MKKVLYGGLGGGFILIIWLIVVDGILGFMSNIEMDQCPSERTVYEFLREHITEPGRYICNPEVMPDQRFPGNEPIFAVHYTGLGHDDSGQEMLVGLLVMLLAPLVGAWLLWHASSRVLSSYLSRVLFLMAIGFVVALFGTFARFGLASYSFGDTVALIFHDFAAWMVAGLFVAWRVRTDKSRIGGKAG